MESVSQFAEEDCNPSEVWQKINVCVAIYRSFRENIKWYFLEHVIVIGEFSFGNGTDFMDVSSELKPGKCLQLACPSSDRPGTSGMGWWGKGAGDREGDGGERNSFGG